MSHQTSDIITPKALLLDERLTPLERNAWLTFRVLASYDALRKYLPSAPGSKRATLETVSRTVLCLRLPVTTLEQRAVLDEVHRLAVLGSFIPSHKIYIQQRHTYDGQCKAARLSNMHGLRYRYAQIQY
jgi:hypothetical protein